MIEILLAYYVGLMVFVLNGLQLVALRQKQRELAVKGENLRRLLVRLKLRR